MNRVNLVRQMRQKKTNHHKVTEQEHNLKREAGWNDRFYLGKIPTATIRSKPTSFNYLTSQFTKKSSAKPRRMHSNTSSRIHSTYTRLPSTHYQDEFFGVTPQQPAMNYNNSTNMNNPSSIDKQKYLKDLWDNLGVVSDYRQFFNMKAESFSNGGPKNEFYDLEINSLHKLENALIKLSQAITARENAKTLLQTIDKVVQQKYVSSEDKLPQDKVNEIVKCINNIRMNSINVVNLMNKVRELCFYGIANRKFNFEVLCYNYNYRHDYLVQMNYDMDFLYGSTLNYYFDFAENGGDPFLIAVANHVPLPEEMIAQLPNCLYLITQDEIYAQLNNVDSGQRNDNNNNSSNSYIKTHSAIEAVDKNKSGDYYGKEELLKKLEEFERNATSGKGNVKLGAIKGKGNSGGDDYVQRILNKESEMKWDEDSDSDLDVEGTKKELEEIRKFEEERKKEKMRVKKLEEMREKERSKVKEKEKEEKESEKRRKKEEEERRKKEKEDKERKRKEEEERMRKEKEDKEKEEKEMFYEDNEEIVEEEQNIDEDEQIREQKEEEERLRREQEEEEERLRREQEEQERLRKEQEEQERLRKEKEEQERLRREQEEQERLRKEQEEQERIKKEKEQEEEKKRLQEEQLKSQTNPQHISPTKTTPHQLTQSPKPSIRQSRAVTPESHAKRPQDSYKHFFFNGNLSDFLPTYKTYYPSIPLPQKQIFFISDNILPSITPYHSPKLLICTPKHNKTKICGLCSFHFDPLSFPQSKLIISHLSTSSDTEYQAIITSIIEYLKNHINCSEIYIDLYYNFNVSENKFNIDTEIRDYFKKDLGFKWAKLENLSNHIRYQKMYLKVLSDTEVIMQSQLNPIYDDDNALVNMSMMSQSINMFGYKNKHIQKLNCNVFGIDVMSGVVITLSNSDNSSNDDEDGINYDKYMNVFLGGYMINKLKLDEYTLTSRSEVNTYITWDIEDKDSLSKHVTYKLCNDVNDVDALINEKDDNFNIKSNIASTNTNNANTSYLSLLMNLSLTLTSNMSSIINGVYYNRIETPNMKMLNDKRYPKDNFYLIPTTDNSYSIIIAPITPNNNLKRKLFQSNKNIYEIFNESIYNNLDQVTTPSSALWLPSFEMQTLLTCTCYDSMKDVTITPSTGKPSLTITNIDEYIKVKYGYDKDYMFTIDTAEHDIVIGSNNSNNGGGFLIGIVNVDMLSNLNMSVIMLMYISSEYYIKAN